MHCLSVTQLRGSSFSMSLFNCVIKMKQNTEQMMLFWESYKGALSSMEVFIQFIVPRSIYLDIGSPVDEGRRERKSVLKILIELFSHPWGILVLSDQRLSFIQVSDNFSTPSLGGSSIMSLLRQLGRMQEKAQTHAAFLFPLT